MKQLILTHQLKPQELEVLKGKFSEEDFFFDELLNEKKESSQSPYATFIAVESGDGTKEVQELLSQLKSTSCFMILRTESFENMKIAFENKVEGVFISELSGENIDLCLIKLELLSIKQKKDIPKEETLELFSAPMNVQNNSQLFTILKKYFSHFQCEDSFGILTFEARSIRRLGNISHEVDLSPLDSAKFPRRFIGETVLLASKGENSVIATPIFESEGSYEWLIIELESSKQSYLLNDLFYRFLDNVFIYKKTKENERSLELLAGTDDVTGLLNQRSLSQDLQNAIEEHEAQHDTFSIMFIDVDHFKQVNDQHGHVIGSKILTDLGRLLAKILRKSDHIYRYGGDEFVIIMPTINVGVVHEVALRVLKQIKAFDFPIGDNKFYKMSVSIGLAEYPTDAKSAIEIIQFADEMMYKSKESGRGKVFHINEVDS